MMLITVECLVIYVSIAITQIAVLVASQDDFHPLAISEEFWKLKNNEEDDDEMSYKKLRLTEKDLDQTDPTCWVKLDIKNLFKSWRELDETYDNVRTLYNKAIATEDFDSQMLQNLVNNSGRAQRTLHNYGDQAWLIPAGLNLGGYSMTPTKDSMLFFHRMKLVDNTQFIINFLHTNLYNMTLEAVLSLNDLHLVGEYERVKTHHDSNILFYHPTFGKIGVTLRQTEYKIFASYRMLKDRLLVEMINSKLEPGDIIITYHNNATGSNTEKGSDKFLGECLTRMKLDLDHWLKDFFNDYLAYLPLKDVDNKDQFLKYDKLKVLLLSEYIDKALFKFTERLQHLHARALALPQFTIITSNGMKIKLMRGVLRGLDSMHRVSVATGVLHKKIPNVDAIIGFSKLKVEYRYEAQLMEGVPPVYGTFMLHAHQMEAHMTLLLMENPEAFDLKIMIHGQTRPEDLIVEGALNRRIANFKHILQNQIIAIMSNMMYFHIRMLNKLAKCDPDPPLPNHVDTGEIFSKEETIKSEAKLGGSDEKENDKNANGLYNPGFSVNREDSAEIILPPAKGENEGKTIKLKYEEHFSLKEHNEKDK